MNSPPMFHAGFVPLSHYQGTQDQDTVLMLNGGMPYAAPELTYKEKAIVLYHHPDAIFPERDLNICPQPEPCPIAEARLIDQINDALSQPRNYQEYPLYATPEQESEIAKWLAVYHKDPSSIISPANRESLMKPYERNAKPMHADNKFYKIATNIIRTYAKGKHRYSAELYSAIAESNDEWLIQKMAKFMFWHVGEGELPPRNETADEMATRWELGDVTDLELRMLDQQEEMERAVEFLMNVFGAENRKVQRRALEVYEDGDMLITDDDEGELSGSEYEE